MHKDRLIGKYWARGGVTRLGPFLLENAYHNDLPFLPYHAPDGP